MDRSNKKYNNDAAQSTELVSPRAQRASQTSHARKARKKKAKYQKLSKARLFDQFNTCPKVAAYLYSVFCNYFDPTRYQCIEPSAGEGAFSDLLPSGSIAYDIDPKGSNIIKADFFKVVLPTGNPIAIIGNPPFGKNSSMAVKFFNRAAGSADVIAFVLPKTFKKVSVQNRLDDQFHLVHEEILPERSFIFNGEPKSVPTVFQIWVKRNERRFPKILPVKHEDFEFTKPALADFAIQRVGKDAGKIHFNFGASQNSHYFIKEKVAASSVLSRMMRLDLSEVASWTAGNPSIAKTELVAAFTAQKSTTSRSQSAVNSKVSLYFDCRSDRANYSMVYADLQPHCSLRSRGKHRAAGANESITIPPKHVRYSKSEARCDAQGTCDLRIVKCHSEDLM